MPDRFWRGGTGSWTTTNTANWSTTDGGAGGASVPTSADNVYFTGLSGGGTCTVTSGTRVCAALYFSNHGRTQYNGTFAGTGIVSLNGEFAISPIMTWTHTGQIQIGGSGARQVISNGKTITSSLLRAMTSGTLTMSDAFTTTGQFRGISGTSGTWDLGTFTHTAAEFDFSQYGSGNTLVFGTGAKLVASSSGSAVSLNTTSSFLHNITGTPLVDILSPPSGSTSFIRTNPRTTAQNGYQLTLVASGTGIIEWDSNYSGTNAVRTVTIGAGGGYTINNMGFTDSLVINSGFTGTLTGQIIPLPLNSGGATINFNGYVPPGNLSFGQDNTSFPIYSNPITFLSNVSITRMWLNRQVWNLNGYDLNINSRLATTPGLSVNAAGATTLDWGTGSGTVKIRTSVSTAQSVYVDGGNAASNLTLTNRRAIHLLTDSNDGYVDTAITGTIPAARRFSFRIAFLNNLWANYQVTFTNTNGTSGCQIHDLIIDNVQASTAGSLQLSGNLTGPSSISNNPRCFNTIYFDSGSTQTITSGAMVWNSTLRFDGFSTANTVVSLADNYTTHDAGTGTSGNVGLYMGLCTLQLNSFYFRCQELSFAFFTDTAGSGISFGTGSLRFFRLAGGACISGSPPNNITSGVWSGSRLVDLEVPASGQTINLPSVLTSLVLNVRMIAGAGGGTGNITIGSCNDLTVNSSSDPAGTNISIVSNNIVLNANLSTASTLDIVDNRSTAANTITSNGYSLSATTIQFQKTASTTLNDALTIGGNATLIQGSLNLQSFTLTMTSGAFNLGATTGARTLNMGTGSLYFAGTSQLNMPTNTGLTLSGTSRQVFYTTPTTGVTKTFTTSTTTDATYALDMTFVVVGTGGTISGGAQASGFVRSLTIPGGTYTFNSNGDFFIFGDLTVNGNITAYTGTTNRYMQGASGTQFISTNGFTFGRSAETLFLNSSGSAKQLSSNSVFAGPVQLLGNALNLNNFRLTALSFTSSNSTARSIDFSSSGAIRVTGTGTVWNTSTNTNLTVTGTNRFVEPNLNAAQTLSFGTPAEANTFDVSVPSTAGNFTLTFTANNNVRNLTFANVAYTVANIALNVYGGLNILGTTPTFTSGSNGWTFSATSGSHSITTNGELIERPITINAPGGTYSLGSALTMTYNLTLTAGSFNASNFNATILNFVSNNSNVRSLTMGNGNWTLGAGTDVWNITTSTNMTLTRGTGEIIMPPSGGGNFRGGGLTYPKIRFRAGGTYLFTGTNSRFADLIRDSAVVTSFTINFGSGETFFFDDFTISGISPSVQINIGSSSTTQHNLSKSSGVVSVNFLSILRSNATGGAAWYAGTGSTNAGSNTGWIFTAPPQASGNMLMVFM